MRRVGPGLYAVISVLLGAASAVLTNLVTQRWSWTLAAGLAGLTAALAVVAWIDRTRTTATASTRVVQTAKRRGRIEHSGVTASGGAQVRQTAQNDGTISRSGITAHGASGEQTADDATIVDSPLDLRD